MSRTTSSSRKQYRVASLRWNFWTLLILATCSSFVEMRHVVAQDEVGAANPESTPQASSARSISENRTEVRNGDTSVQNDKKKSEISDEDRAYVLKFAKENHPELAGLLEQLQKSRPNEFAKAVRELHQQVRALDRVRERSPARYEEQLASWKRDSKIRLLMARWAKKNDPALEQEIRALLTERREARLAQLRSERERLNQMQRKLDEQLLDMEQPMDQQISAEWDLLSRRNRKTDRKDP